jgi:trans-2,3-dihydro-3-hydroxyanthranilate isomerase
MSVRTIEFHFVDVFADEPLTGNPLVVVPDADRLDKELMCRIAREFNQSETTFLLKPTRPEANHRLRSFTPSGSEVFGAGHNALGAWWWLADAGRLGELVNGLRARQEIGPLVLPVDILASAGSLTMIGLIQGGPESLAMHDDPVFLAAALGLAAGDIARSAPVISTGTPHLLVQTMSRAAVDRAEPDAKALLRELESVGAQGCYLFSLEPVSPVVSAYAASSIPRSGSGRIPRRAAQRGHSPGISISAGSRNRSSWSSKVTAWGGPAGWWCRWRATLCV